MSQSTVSILIVIALFLSKSFRDLVVKNFMLTIALAIGVSVWLVAFPIGGMLLYFLLSWLLGLIPGANLNKAHVASLFLGWVWFLSGVYLIVQHIIDEFRWNSRFIHPSKPDIQPTSPDHQTEHKSIQ